jgi:hypothetical protein
MEGDEMKITQQAVSAFVCSLMLCGVGTVSAELEQPSCIVPNMPSIFDGVLKRPADERRGI